MRFTRHLHVAERCVDYATPRPLQCILATDETAYNTIANTRIPTIRAWEKEFETDIEWKAKCKIAIQMAMGSDGDTMLIVHS